VNPGLQVHVNDPAGVFVHVALALQSSVLAVHSFVSAQPLAPWPGVAPAGVYPELHVHVNDPCVSAHVAFALQSSVLAVHSLILMQPPEPCPGFTPPGIQPPPHVHVYEPTGTFVHVAFALQLFSELDEHSLMSTHGLAIVPVPV
jgi:hypothetical protein